MFWYPLVTVAGVVPAGANVEKPVEADIFGLAANAFEFDVPVGNGPTFVDAAVFWDAGKSLDNLGLLFVATAPVDADADACGPANGLPA